MNLTSRYCACDRCGEGIHYLEKVLQSHAVIHIAGGELFRQVLCSACARCGFLIICTNNENC